MYDIHSVLIAAAMIVSPVDSPVPAEANTAAVRMWIQQLAVPMEILDPREVKYMCSRPEDFSTDVQLLRRRYAELKDAPSVMDSMRFPEREAVNDFLSFNRAYKQHLDMAQQVQLHKWLEYQQAIQETEQLYQLWDNVRDARCEYYYVTVRRQALLRLRDKLGNQDYYAGKLPPYVPLWRFQSIDR